MEVQGSWFAQAVDRLIEHRAAGASFDTAWSLTMIAMPPSARDSGGWRPQLAINGDETIVGFFRQACENAWHDERGAVASGNGPALKHFRGEMIRDTDASEPARRPLGGSRFRRAA